MSLINLLYEFIPMGLALAGSLFFVLLLYLAGCWTELRTPLLPLQI